MEHNDITGNDCPPAADCGGSEGAEPVREYTNKAGATNLTKNPLLILWDDLNKSALAYWRDLGLTPSSYKKLAGETTAENAPSLCGTSLPFTRRTLSPMMTLVFALLGET